MGELWELVPDADVLLALQPEEFGGAVLQVLGSRADAQFIFGNFLGEIFYIQHTERYPRSKESSISLAIAEARRWLASQCIPDGEQVTVARAVISEKGRGGTRLRSRSNHGFIAGIDIAVEPHPPSTDQLDLDAGARRSMIDRWWRGNRSTRRLSTRDHSSSVIFTARKLAPSAAGVSPRACRQRKSRLTATP